MRLDYLESQLNDHRQQQAHFTPAFGGPPPPTPAYGINGGVSAPMRHNSPIEVQDLELESDMRNMSLVGRRASTGNMKQAHEKISISRPPSGVKSTRRGGKHLYRPNSGKPQPDINVGDLIGEGFRGNTPASYETDQVSQVL